MRNPNPALPASAGTRALAPLVRTTVACPREMSVDELAGLLRASREHNRKALWPLVAVSCAATVGFHLVVLPTLGHIGAGVVCAVAFLASVIFGQRLQRSFREEHGLTAAAAKQINAAVHAGMRSGEIARREPDDDVIARAVHRVLNAPSGDSLPAPAASRADPSA